MGDDGRRKEGKVFGAGTPAAIEQRLICKVASSLDNGGRWEGKEGKVFGAGTPACN